MAHLPSACRGVIAAKPRCSIKFAISEFAFASSPERNTRRRPSFCSGSVASTGAGIVLNALTPRTPGTAAATPPRLVGTMDAAEFFRELPNILRDKDRCKANCLGFRSERRFYCDLLLHGIDCGMIHRGVACRSSLRAMRHGHNDRAATECD